MYNNHPSNAEAEQAATQAHGFVAAMIICVLFSMFFTAIYFFRVFEQAEVSLKNRINPNYASPASLVRLDNIGYVRAEAIVGYRQQQSGFYQDGVVFKRAGDLQKIKGIGPKTVETIEGWLDFEPAESSRIGFKSE